MIDKFDGAYRFLSNFAVSKIYYKGMWFNTAEHAYQCHKLTDEQWSEWSVKFSMSHNPAEAKRWGQEIDLRPDWEEVKLDIMYEIVHAKFSQNEHLLKRLLDTDDEELVEGNTWGDRFWGVCKGSGENHLGKTLMRIRKELGNGNDS